MVRDTMTFIDDHFSRRVVVTGLSNEVRRPIPLVAVREALVNAVVHADYSQRGGPIRAALFDDRQSEQILFGKQTRYFLPIHLRRHGNKPSGPRDREHRSLGLTNNQAA